MTCAKRVYHRKAACRSTRRVPRNGIRTECAPGNSNTRNGMRTAGEIVTLGMPHATATPVHDLEDKIPTQPESSEWPHHSRLISPYLSRCSAVSQIRRPYGHSKCIEPKEKLGTVDLGNTPRCIDKSLTECLPFP